VSQDASKRFENATFGGEREGEGGGEERGRRREGEGESERQMIGGVRGGEREQDTPDINPVIVTGK
jgi:hypothetical protein